MPEQRGPRTFGAKELRQFLTALDHHLEQPASIIVLGGAAAVIGYGVETGTLDIDTRDSIAGAVEAAASAARAETGFEIPMGASAIADYPYFHEDRLKRELSGLERLTVFVLEKHDLALSKIVRGNDHDQEQITSIHEHDPLDFDTLVERYLQEMKYANTDLRSMDLNFLNCIDNLFGERKRAQVQRAIEAVRPPR